MSTDRYTNREIDLKDDAIALRLEKKFDQLVHEVKEGFLMINARIDQQTAHTDQEIQAIRAGADKIDLNLRWMQIIGGALFAVMMSLLGILLTKLH